jgi:DNA-binding NtrC family response regulator
MASAPRGSDQREREERSAGCGREPDLGRHARPSSRASPDEARTKSGIGLYRAHNLLALVVREGDWYARPSTVKADERGRTVLVVDDDLALGKVLVGLLSQAGLVAQHVRNGEEALTSFGASAYDLVITDLRMPGMDGLTLVRELKRIASDVPVILLTAHGSIPIAVEALRAGASDFLTKPFDREEIVYTVHKALQLGDHAAARPPDRDAQKPVFGSSAPMREVTDVVRRAAKSTSNVLLRGESGTGKEVAARTIHAESQRSQGPFVAVNCAALPEQLLESELFGYEKGAFTGAVARRPGRVELARGGTLFLDEIGDVPPPAQAKLLRLLQEKEYQPLGGTRTEKADVRFIAATHRDLEAMVRAGQFREDLYYRLNVIPVWLPPLRERPGDVAELAARFAESLGAENGRPHLRLDDRALARLREHAWPGNVRELMCVIERLIVFTDGDLVSDGDVLRELERIRGRAASTPPSSRPEDEPHESSRTVPSSGDDTLASRRLEAERSAVEDALRRAGQNRTQAARLLGVSRRTLYKRLSALGMGAE